MHPRILVAESDHALRGALLRALRAEEFEPVPAVDGATAVRLAARGAAAAVLDTGLPDADGREVCRALRADGFCAPVVLTSARHRLADRLACFSAGGDDYLAKPFHLAELTARLRAVLLRAGPPRPVAAGDLALDPVRRRLTVRGAPVALTPTEFRILAALLAADGELVRRRALVRAGWPAGGTVAENTLDQYLTRLRRKLRAAGTAASVHTDRGRGHRLA